MPIPALAATVVSPFVQAALPALINAAGQAAPSLIRIFGRGSEVSERNARAAEELARIAQAATQQSTVEAAVQHLQADAQARAAYQAAVLSDLDRLVGMVERLVRIDDESRDRASARARGESWDMLPFLADRGFKLVGAALVAQIALLVIGFLADVSNEAMMILLTLLVATMTKFVDRWSQLYDYRVGSSAGSKASGDAVRAIADRAQR